MESYNEIELTEEETNEALRIARRAKKIRLTTEAYNNKIKEVKIGPPKFNASQLRDYVLNKNPDFIIDDYNRDVFKALLLYFSGDETAIDLGISLRKGIVLYGPIGCGKTEMMRVFSMNTFRPFIINPVRKITDKYAEKKGGVLALQEFSSLLEVYPHTNLGISNCGRCFDDLGTEESRKNYGNELNVMQDILYKIYDDKLMGNFHLTTNLTVNDIEDTYGKRIRSRFKEMFNILSFSGDAPDRRG